MDSLKQKVIENLDPNLVIKYNDILDQMFVEDIDTVDTRNILTQNILDKIPEEDLSEFSIITDTICQQTELFLNELRKQLNIKVS